MKKFYKVEAFRPGEESALKYTFHVYSENLSQRIWCIDIPSITGIGYGLRT